ncbi:OTU domain-containing protein [Micromonospora marina]|uniref:OTU domain-containing protein n=1 Tax=Micromonospora marina TaxID=307120 RepID=UPI0034521DA3
MGDVGRYSSIEFPNWARALSVVLTGEPPGVTREGRLRSLADLVQRVGGEVAGSEAALSASVRRVSGGVRGRAGGAFADRMRELLGAEGLLAQGSAFLDGSARNLRLASTQVQYTKMMTLAGLLELWLEFQLATLFSMVNPVGAAAWLAARLAVARLLLRFLRSRLGMALAALLSGVLMEVAADFLVQAAQRNSGWRRGFDGSLLGSSALAGSLGGAFGLALGGGAGVLSALARGAVGRPGVEAAAEMGVGIGTEVLVSGTVSAIESGEFVVTGFAATAGLAGAGAHLFGHAVGPRLQSLSGRTDGAREAEGALRPGAPLALSDPTGPARQPYPDPGDPPRTAGVEQPGRTGGGPVEDAVGRARVGHDTTDDHPRPATGSPVTGTGIGRRGTSTAAMSMTGRPVDHLSPAAGMWTPLVIGDPGAGRSAARAVPRVVHMIWPSVAGVPGNEVLANVHAWADQAAARGWRLRVWADGPSAAVLAQAGVHVDPLRGLDVRGAGRLPPALVGAAPDVLARAARWAALYRYGGLAVDIELPAAAVMLPVEPVWMGGGPGMVPYLSPAHQVLGSPAGDVPAGDLRGQVRAVLTAAPGSGPIAAPAGSVFAGDVLHRLTTAVDDGGGSTSADPVIEVLRNYAGRIGSSGWMFRPDLVRAFEPSHPLLPLVDQVPPHPGVGRLAAEQEALSAMASRAVAEARRRAEAGIAPLIMTITAGGTPFVTRPGTSDRARQRYRAERDARRLRADLAELLAYHSRPTADQVGMVALSPHKRPLRRRRDGPSQSARAGRPVPRPRTATVGVVVGGRPVTPPAGRAALDAVTVALRLATAPGPDLPGVARLARWVAEVEARPGVDGGSPTDCVPRALGAFLARYGHLGGLVRGVDATDVREPERLVTALTGRLAPLSDPQVVIDWVTARPGSAALVVVRPPNRPAHVFWLVSDDRAAPATARWLDTQAPGLFGAAARPDDAWGRMLSLPGTRVAFHDHRGRPAADPPAAAASGLVDALLDPTGRRRAGALPPSAGGSARERAAASSPERQVPAPAARARAGPEGPQQSGYVLLTGGGARLEMTRRPVYAGADGGIYASPQLAPEGAAGGRWVERHVVDVVPATIEVGEVEADQLLSVRWSNGTGQVWSRLAQAVSGRAGPYADGRDAQVDLAEVFPAAEGFQLEAPAPHLRVTVPALPPRIRHSVTVPVRGIHELLRWLTTGSRLDHLSPVHLLLRRSLDFGDLLANQFTRWAGGDARLPGPLPWYATLDAVAGLRGFCALLFLHVSSVGPAGAGLPPWPPVVVRDPLVTVHARLDGLAQTFLRSYPNEIRRAFLDVRRGETGESVRPWGRPAAEPLPWVLAALRVPVAGSRTRTVDDMLTEQLDPAGPVVAGSSTGVGAPAVTVEITGFREHLRAAARQRSQHLGELLRRVDGLHARVEGASPWVDRTTTGSLANHDLIRLLAGIYQVGAVLLLRQARGRHSPDGLPLTVDQLDRMAELGGRLILVDAGSLAVRQLRDAASEVADSVARMRGLPAIPTGLVGYLGDRLSELTAWLGQTWPRSVTEPPAELSAVTGRDDVETVFLPVRREVVRHDALAGIAGGSSPLRLVPTGDPPPSLVRWLRSELAGARRPVFVPEPGGTVRAVHGDLTVVRADGTPGEWTRVDGWADTPSPGELRSTGGRLVGEVGDASARPAGPVAGQPERVGPRLPTPGPGPFDRQGSPAAVPRDVPDDPNVLSAAQVDGLVRARRYARWTEPDGDCWFSSLVAAARDVDAPTPAVARLAADDPVRLRWRLAAAIDGHAEVDAWMRDLARDPADYARFRDDLRIPGRWAHHLFDVLFGLAPRLLGVEVFIHHPQTRGDVPADPNVLQLLLTHNHYLPALRADRDGVQSRFRSDPVADVLLAGLRSSTQPGAVLRQDGLLGPDLFGLRRPAPPGFPSLNHRSLTTDQLVPLLCLLDLAADRPPQDRELGEPAVPHDERTRLRRRRHDDERSWALRPDLVAADLRRLSTDAEMPLLVHSIWFGSTLTEQNPTTAEIRNLLARISRDAGRDYRVVLWTDLTRGDFARAAAVPPTGQPDLAYGVRDMREWARRHRILIVDVHEVYHAGVPFALRGPFLLELSRLTGGGYAAASDIIRQAIMFDFGGVYTDGDNPFLGAPAMDHDVRTAIEGRGYAVHRVGDGVNNSASVAVRGHPLVAALLRRMADNYEQPQRRLITARRQGRAGNAAYTGRGSFRRHSIINRTGPGNLIRIRQWGGHASAGELPSLTGFQIGSAHSWLPGRDPLAPADRWTADDPPRVLRAIVAALVRDLYNREGDLHLTRVAPLVNGLTDPPAGWRAALAYILDEPRLRPLVRSVTDRVLVDGAGPHSTQVRRVDLPVDVAGHLGLVEPADGSDPEGVWWLAELVRPVRLSIDGRQRTGARPGRDLDTLAATRGDLRTVFVDLAHGRPDLRELTSLRPTGRPVRMVPTGGAAMDAGTLDLIRGALGWLARTVFVPAVGSVVRAHRIDLIADGGWRVLDPRMPDLGYHTGEAVLARSGAAASEDEMIAWVAGRSLLDVAIEPQPGDLDRGYAVMFRLSFPSADRIEAVLADLRRLRLTSQRSLAISGVSDTAVGGEWRITVDPRRPGQAVVGSPLLDGLDGRQLALVLASLQRAGGEPERDGLRIRVATYDLPGRDDDQFGVVVKRLGEVVSGLRDTLARLAAPPTGARYHRGADGGPAQDDSRDVSAQFDMGVTTYREPYLGFSFWGAALDLGVVQARIQVSRALVRAAADPGHTPEPPQPVGGNYANRLHHEGRGELDRLLALLPSTAEFHREQIRQLWSRTSWQPPIVAGLTGMGHLLWIGPTRSGPAWTGFDGVAATDRSTLLVLVPPGDRIELDDIGHRPATTGEQRDTLAGLPAALGDADDVVVLLLDPTLDAGGRAWTIRPARAWGTYRVVDRDDGVWSLHGWELMAPDRTVHHLASPMLNGETLRQALSRRRR